MAPLYVIIQSYRHFKTNWIHSGINSGEKKKPLHDTFEITNHLQESILLGSGEIWANLIWNKADPYTVTGDNLVRKQAQASNSCSLSFKASSLHALETETEKGMRTNNLPRDSCFQQTDGDAISGVHTGSTEGRDGTRGPYLPHFGSRLLVDRSGRWLPKVTRQMLVIWGGLQRQDIVRSASERLSEQQDCRC